MSYFLGFFINSLIGKRFIMNILMIIIIINNHHYNIIIASSISVNSPFYQEILWA